MSSGRPGTALADFPQIMSAIADLVAKARLSDVPIIDVEAATRNLMDLMPEAAQIGEERLRNAVSEVLINEREIGLRLSGSIG